MPDYDSENFDPPAPVAYVNLSESSNWRFVVQRAHVDRYRRRRNIVTAGVR